MLPRFDPTVVLKERVNIDKNIRTSRNILLGKYLCSSVDIRVVIMRLNQL